MNDAIDRALQRIQALRNAALQSVERDRGFYASEGRVRLADTIAKAYDEAISILREERTRR